MRINLGEDVEAVVIVYRGRGAGTQPTPNETRQVIAALQATLPEQESRRLPDQPVYDWNGVISEDEVQP